MMDYAEPKLNKPRKNEAKELFKSPGKLAVAVLMTCCGLAIGALSVDAVTAGFSPSTQLQLRIIGAVIGSQFATWLAVKWLVKRG